MAKPLQNTLRLTALFLCLALLCACGGGQHSSHSIIMAAPPQNNLSSLPPESALADSAVPDPATDEVMRLETAATALSGAYTGGDAGAYTIASYDDGSADILYFDYAARTMSMLENPPKPENAAVRGHIADCWGGVCPILYGGQLYLFRLGGGEALAAEYGEAGRAAIMRLGPDGSGQTVLPLPDGWTFLLASAVLADGDFLYFLMQDTADGATILVKADAALTACEELRRYEPGFTYAIEGFWEKGPVITAASLLPPMTDPDFNTYWENQQFTLLAQGMNTGITRQLSQWTQGRPGVTQGSTFYHWNADDATVYALDANTEAQTAIATLTPPADYVQAQFMRTTLDGKLRLQFSTNRYTRNYAINPATGEVQELALDERDDNLSVCAEGGGLLLVRYGEEWVASEKAPDFLPGAEASPTNPEWIKMPQYALTDAASYFAGQRNFAEIQDLVYG